MRSGLLVLNTAIVWLTSLFTLILWIAPNYPQGFSHRVLAVSTCKNSVISDFHTFWPYYDMESRQQANPFFKIGWQKLSFSVFINCRCIIGAETTSHLINVELVATEILIIDQWTHSPQTWAIPPPFLTITASIHSWVLSRQKPFLAPPNGTWVVCLAFMSQRQM